MSVKSGEMSEKVRRPKRKEITKTDRVIVSLIALHVQNKMEDALHRSGKS